MITPLYEGYTGIKPNANLDALWGYLTGATALPAGLTTPDLASYLENNKVFNVFDRMSAVQRADVRAGTLLVDVATPILTTIAACVAAGGGVVDFPPGKYRTGQNILCAISDPPMGVRLRGVMGATIIVPTAAVTIAFNIGSSGTAGDVFTRFIMDGFRIDMVNTGAGAVGVKVGDHLITSVPYSTDLTFRDVEVYHATGAGAKAWWVADCVKARFENCYGGASSTNLHIEAFDGNLPTALYFDDCDFRSGTGHGIVINTGFGIRFVKGVVEANALHGLHLNPPGGANVLGVEFDGTWFEGNYNADPTKWQVHCDGTGAGTVQVRIANCRFNGNAKSIYFKAVFDSVIDNPFPTDVADTVHIDTGVQGWLLNWPSNNLALATRFTNLSPLSFRHLAGELDAIHVNETWTAPALLNGWINNGGAYANAGFAIDPSGWVRLRGVIKNGTITISTTLFTLPLGYRPPFAVIIPAVSNGAFCALQVDTAGAVSLAAAANATYLSLDGFAFRTY